MQFAPKPRIARNSSVVDLRSAGAAAAALDRRPAQLPLSGSQSMHTRLASTYQWTNVSAAAKALGYR
jgi:hypothetical protein